MADTVTAPIATQVPIAPNTQLAELIRLFETQFKNKQTVKCTSVKDRIKKLRHLEKVVLAKRKQIQNALYNDFRKPAIQTDFSEIYPVVSEIRNYAANLYDWAAPREVESSLVFLGSSAKIIHEPKGNILLLCPWNYPFQIPLKNALGAYGAGNVCIIKPSEFTPHTAAIITEIVKEVFAENEMVVVTGDHTVSQELLKMKFDHVHFTGSPLHGKAVMRAAADNLTSVTLELGGKSPSIIDGTANISKTARNIIWSKYTNAGQTCIAADYILVDAQKKDEFVKSMIAHTRKAFGENAQESPAYCRIINARHFARIKRLLDDAVQKGAKLEDGGRTDATENFIAPTILTNVTMDMQIMHEEIFGPILPVLSYQSVDEALRLVNAGEKPLSLYIYSKSSKNIQHIINNTSAGATCVNEAMVHNGHANLPFGGINNSGIGKSHGLYGYKEFTHERPVITAWHAPSELLTPPFDKLNETVVNAMLKFL